MLLREYLKILTWVFIIDLIQTFIGIRYLNLLEMNPLSNYMGIVQFVTIKLIIIILLYLILINTTQKDFEKLYKAKYQQLIYKISMISFILIMCFIILWNTNIIYNKVI